MTRERPILFSAPMVRAILDGRKTQTRRVVKPQPPARAEGMRPHKMTLQSDDEGIEWWVCSQSAGHGGWYSRSPCGGPPTKYGQVSRLWVRETFGIYDRQAELERDTKYVFYRADDEHKYSSDGLWKPSIFMPRWASRITLEIVNVRVERVQDISAGNAKAEGPTLTPDRYDPGFMISHREAFRNLWDSLNAKRGYGWDKDPYVWVIEFKRP